MIILAILSFGYAMEIVTTHCPSPKVKDQWDIHIITITKKSASADFFVIKFFY